ncbi:hypothetical protein ElyMa_003634700 [Elysia marginata]|uniref:Uncharacterized protein n=1 Tax=Elysia marginata TaxID=1093978 RepID=A0AAV4EUF5_9GAST|nr:hypothetical protein ElyMa_003634700 [Elysia marginata]
MSAPVLGVCVCALEDDSLMLLLSDCNRFFYQPKLARTSATPVKDISTEDDRTDATEYMPVVECLQPQGSLCSPVVNYIYCSP